VSIWGRCWSSERGDQTAPNWQSSQGTHAHELQFAFRHFRIRNDTARRSRNPAPSAGHHHGRWCAEIYSRPPSGAYYRISRRLGMTGVANLRGTPARLSRRLSPGLQAAPGVGALRGSVIKSTRRPQLAFAHAECAPLPWPNLERAHWQSASFKSRATGTICRRRDRAGLALRVPFSGNPGFAHKPA